MKHALSTRPAATAVAGIVLLLAALPLVIGGALLISLGGSWYYLLAGLAVALSGGLTFFGRPLAIPVFAAALLGTLVWSVAEAGLEFWPLVPRLAGPFMLAGILALVAPQLVDTRKRVWARRFGHSVIAAVIFVMGFGVAHGLTLRPLVAGVPEAYRAAGAGRPAAPSSDEWRSYGRTLSGSRFVPFSQITAGNVNKLEVAWTFRMGEISRIKGHIPPEEQNTPLQVGDRLYACNGINIVFALDADTGRLIWRYDPGARTPTLSRCRGLGYHEDVGSSRTDAPGATSVPLCSRRIIMTTVDARMIEMDAATGALCPDFGKGGQIDLRVGIGDDRPGYYYLTSAPTVVRDLVIIGGWVMDNQETNSPSGVVRAFDVHSGKLVWAWDMARPERTGLPPAGETYTKDTPNVWGTPSVDDRLGLVFLPTGNRTPDFWGAGRSKVVDDHTAAIVALDISTGREKWTFRSVNHDIWDYDIGAQPLLYDIADGKGGFVPALVALTKRGQIFLLDRRTGKPLAKVVERPVPHTGAAPGDWLAPTQPYSVGMPAIGTEPLSEARMWGATIYDQLWCRIEFRKLNYQGEFTPQSEKEILVYPSFMGGFNWGGGAIDEQHGYLIANDIRLAIRQKLVPRAIADPRLKEAGEMLFAPEHIGLRPMYGYPWAVEQEMFKSPLGIPCNQPPWGTISAIDLKTRRLAWQVPAGTIEDTGPFQIPTAIPAQVGMPTLGGPMTTAGGLTFFAGTQDFYLRAFDTSNGREVWKARLPVGAQATPMSFVSPRTQRQYVVIVAGGMRYTASAGDYVIAYALPS